jgi:hypothetical protein
LAHVVAPGRVLSIDVDRQVLAEAWDHLHAFADRRVELRHADGRCGYAEAAPYDRIMVTAATPDLEPAWLEQLAPGGLLLTPLALAPGLAFIACGTVADGTFDGRLTRAAYFMPLRAEGESGSSEAAALPVYGPLQIFPAPWAGWFERKRSRPGWLGFVQAMVFYGLLRGLRVSYQMLADGEATYGVSDRDGAAVCWLGEQQWRVSGRGRDLGEGLWRAFLDAGGPWPTEFRLRATARGDLAPGSGREVYERPGPRCRQVWELREQRERPGWV